jgi:hypothetical protein
LWNFAGKKQAPARAAADRFSRCAAALPLGNLEQGRLNAVTAQSSAEKIKIRQM